MNSKTMLVALAALVVGGAAVWASLTIKRLPIDAFQANMMVPTGSGTPPGTATIDLGRERNFIAWGTITGVFLPQQENLPQGIQKGPREFVFVYVRFVDGKSTPFTPEESGMKVGTGSFVGRGQRIEFAIAGQDIYYGATVGPLKGKYYFTANVLAWD